MIQNEIITVSQYLDKINSKLKVERAKIVGEICNIQEYPGRTYMYFSIKDSKDQSTIKCFMWKRDFKISNVFLKDGMEILVTAYPSIYKPNGGLSMQVELVEMVGEGALQLAYLELKKKLEKEGLFLESRKKPLPDYPQKIGVITSKSGAVINDFLTNIGKFGYKISFVDSRVEGQDAIKDLLLSLALLRKEDLDVLVIMRGGGSLESFQAFNNEHLVRAVAEFPVPVLTGIGHDKDEPLVSLVSDKNVSTPTAVANLLNSTWDDALALVNMGEEKLFSRFESSLRQRQFFSHESQVTIEAKFLKFIETFRKFDEAILRATFQIESAVGRSYERLEERSKELARGFEYLKTRVSDFLRESSKSLDLLSPERRLSQGYSIVRSKGKVVKNIEDVKRGDKLDILVSDGIINSQIT